MQYVDTLDVELEPCPECRGDGWVMQDDEHYTPCDTCEAEDAVMRAEHVAEIDALRAYWAACESDDRAAWDQAVDRAAMDFLPF